MKSGRAWLAWAPRRDGSRQCPWAIVRAACAAGVGDLLCGVATLTPLDAAASKLLARFDRWRDDAALSRDLIDLAMMAPPKALLWKRIRALEGRCRPA